MNIYFALGLIAVAVLVVLAFLFGHVLSLIS